jgi:hypothetical protein
MSIRYCDISIIEMFLSLLLRYLEVSLLNIWVSIFVGYSNKSMLYLRHKMTALSKLLQISICDDPSIRRHIMYANEITLFK